MFMAVLFSDYYKNPPLSVKGECYVPCPSLIHTCMVGSLLKTKLHLHSFTGTQYSSPIHDIKTITHHLISVGNDTGTLAFGMPTKPIEYLNIWLPSASVAREVGEYFREYSLSKLLLLQTWYLCLHCWLFLHI